MTARISKTEWYLQRGIPVGTLVAVLMIGGTGLRQFWNYDVRLDGVEAHLDRIELRLPRIFPPASTRERLIRLEAAIEYSKNELSDIHDDLGEIKKLLNDHARERQRHGGGK